ncbi:MAG: hypothetical protein ACE147_10850 [Candidatus Methylomirabilales bacterium]
MNQLYHFLRAVVRQGDIAPCGAMSEDGYRAAVIGDAIVESARTGRRVPVQYDLWTPDSRLPDASFQECTPQKRRASPRGVR